MNVNLRDENIWRREACTNLFARLFNVFQYERIVMQLYYFDIFVFCRQTKPYQVW